MLRFLADEDFDNDILRGLLHRHPELPIVRVQDVGLASAEDPEILEWAAHDARIVLSHDVRTMIAAAYARVRSGQRMPGLFVARQALPIGTVIEDLLLLALCSVENE